MIEHRQAAAIMLALVPVFTGGQKKSGAFLIDLTTYIHVSTACLAIGIMVQIAYVFRASYHKNKLDSEVLLTYCNLLEDNDDSHQHEVTLTLADFDIDLTKSISMTAVLRGLPPC